MNHEPTRLLNSKTYLLIPILYTMIIDPTLYVYILYFGAMYTIYDDAQFTPTLYSLIYSPIITTVLGYHYIPNLLYTYVILSTIFRHPGRSLLFILLSPIVVIPFILHLAVVNEHFRSFLYAGYTLLTS